MVELKFVKSPATKTSSLVLLRVYTSKDLTTPLNPVPVLKLGYMLPLALRATILFTVDPLQLMNSPPK